MTAAANGNGYGRYTFYAIASGVVFTMVGSVIWIGGLAFEIQQNKSALDSLSLRIVILEADLKTNDLAAANMRTSACQQFAKVETQIGTVETVINTIRVDDLRQRGLIWPKIFSQPYPDTFYEIKVPHEVIPCT